jgi:hypothetical protein
LQEEEREEKEDSVVVVAAFVIIFIVMTCFVYYGTSVDMNKNLPATRWQKKKRIDCYWYVNVHLKRE